MQLDSYYIAIYHIRLSIAFSPLSTGHNHIAPSVFSASFLLTFLITIFGITSPGPVFVNNVVLLTSCGNNLKQTSTRKETSPTSRELNLIMDNCVLSAYEALLVELFPVVTEHYEQWDIATLSGVSKKSNSICNPSFSEILISAYTIPVQYHVHFQ